MKKRCRHDRAIKLISRQFIFKWLPMGKVAISIFVTQGISLIRAGALEKKGDLFAISTFSSLIAHKLFGKRKTGLWHLVVACVRMLC